MSTRVCETIPQQSGAKPRGFETNQSINDLPLTRHPEAGAASVGPALPAVIRSRIMAATCLDS
jgi:hypothetical protein